MNVSSFNPAVVEPALSIAATGPVEGEARLRQNCRMILEWLDGDPGTRLPGLTNQLASALSSTAATIADALEREAAEYDDAISNLRTLLHSRYSSPPPSVASLIDELTALREAVGRALAMVGTMAPRAEDMRRRPKRSEGDAAETEVALAALRSPLLRLPDYSGSHGPEPKAEARATANLELEPSPSLPLPALATPEPDTDLAVELFRSAEALQRDGDFNQAAETYTLALQANPNFGPALSRRGQIRLALGQVDAAIDDFNAVLDLDETAVEAWWWRGDAHAVAGRMDAAIDDYERALALKPDLTRARFNLAVALRRNGDMRRAMSEFSRVLDERPGHAASHLNRGLIHLHLGERTRAEAEFRAALEHDPGCDQARRQLAALAPPIVLVDPPAETKRAVGHLAVDCPKCGHTGDVPLDRLNKVFVCVKCECRFGVRTDGGVVELVATRDGKWVDAPRARAAARASSKRRLAVAGFVMVFVVLPIVGFTGWRSFHAAPPASAEAELPRDLDARAELFGRAWAANDLRTMRRLTSPADEKAVYSWSLRHAPPAAVRSQAANARIETTLKPEAGGQSTVRLRVSPPDVLATAADLTTTWRQRGDTWYFAPTR